MTRRIALAAAAALLLLAAPAHAQLLSLGTCPAGSGQTVVTGSTDAGAGAIVTCTQLKSSDLSDVRGFTDGSIAYVASGALAQDNARLFWDPNNHRLEVGTGANTLVTLSNNGAYNVLSLNGAFGAAGTVGIEGGATGDGTLYFLSGTSGPFRFYYQGSTLVATITNGGIFTSSGQDITDGNLLSCTALSTDAAGKFGCAGSAGFWSRSGTNVSPTTSTDTVSIGTSAAVTQAQLTVATHGITVTGADLDLTAGGARAFVDYSSGARLGCAGNIACTVAVKVGAGTNALTLDSSGNAVFAAGISAGASAGVTCGSGITASTYRSVNGLTTHC